MDKLLKITCCINCKMGEKITIGRVKTFESQVLKNFNYLHTVVKDNLSKLAVSCFY